MPTAHKEVKEEDSVRQMHHDRKMYPSKEVTRGLEVAVSVLPPSYMDASVDNNMRAGRASLIKTALSHSEVPCQTHGTKR